MNYVQKSLLIGLVCLSCQVPVQAFSWQGIAQSFSGIKKSVPLVIDRVISALKNTQSSVAIIAGLGAVTAVAGYNIVRGLKHADTGRQTMLATADPHLFCNWAEGQLNCLDAKRWYVTKISKIFGSVARDNHTFATAIKERLSEINMRNVDRLDEAFRLTYLATAEGAPLLKGPAGVHEFLGLQPDAMHNEFKRARESRVQQYECDIKRGAPENPDLVNTLRQLDYIGRTPFGWANYCAYLQGAQAIEQLPRVAQDRIEPLLYRAMSTQGSYGVL